MRITREQGREVRGALAAQGRDAQRGAVQPGEIQAALRRGVEQALGTQQSIAFVGSPAS